MKQVEPRGYAMRSRGRRHLQCQRVTLWGGREKAWLCLKREKRYSGKKGRIDGRSFLRERNSRHRWVCLSLQMRKLFFFFLTQQRRTAMVAGRSLSVGRGRAQGSYAQEPIDSREVSNLLAEPETGSASALTRVLAPRIRDFLLTTLTKPFPTCMPRSTVVTFLFLLGLPHPRASCRAQSTLGIRYLCQTFLRVFTLPSPTSPFFSQPLHWGRRRWCLSIHQTPGDFKALGEPTSPRLLIPPPAHL